MKAENHTYSGQFTLPKELKDEPRARKKKTPRSKIEDEWARLGEQFPKVRRPRPVAFELLPGNEGLRKLNTKFTTTQHESLQFRGQWIYPDGVMATNRHIMSWLPGDTGVRSEDDMPEWDCVRCKDIDPDYRPLSKAPDWKSVTPTSFSHIFPVRFDQLLQVSDRIYRDSRAQIRFDGQLKLAYAEQMDGRELIPITLDAKYLKEACTFFLMLGKSEGYLGISGQHRVVMITSKRLKKKQSFKAISKVPFVLQMPIQSTGNIRTDRIDPVIEGEKNGTKLKHYLYFDLRDGLVWSARKGKWQGNSWKADQQKATSMKNKKSAPEKIEMVRDLDIELRLIGRFVNLHNKPKSYRQVLAVFNGLNRAIKKGQIRKTDRPTRYHKEIDKVQGLLAKALNGQFSSNDLDEEVILEFDERFVDRLQSIRKQYAVYPSVRLGLRFLGMEGKAPDKDKAVRLRNAIRKAGEKGSIGQGDLNSGFIKNAATALDRYIDGKSSTVSLQKSALSGLAGAVLDCGCQSSSPALLDSPANDSVQYIIAPHRGQAVSFRSDRLPAVHEQSYRFTGPWAELLNRPVKGFSALIYGRPKSGKSTLAADLGGYLAKSFGQVLYASIEEGARGTITERIDRLGAGHPRMEVANYLPADLSRYDFVITDSVSRGRLDLKQMRSLIAAWPDTSFIFIFHVTKDGLPRGSAEFQHEVDVLVEVTDGVAVANGRFGPGEMVVRFA